MLNQIIIEDITFKIDLNGIQFYKSYSLYIPTIPQSHTHYKYGNIKHGNLIYFIWSKQ